MFLYKKKINNKAVSTLPRIFRPVTQNTHIFLFAPLTRIENKTSVNIFMLSTVDSKMWRDHLGP